MRLAGKIALVTGAAHGMGAVTARRFAREGATVIIADVLDEAGATVAADILAHGGRAEYVHLDVSDEQQWRATMSALLARHGRLDVLVNNAGISGALPDRLDLEAFDRLMAVNARGTFLGMKLAIEAMLAGGGGSIVNVSSRAAVIGSPGEWVHYAASKAAVDTLTVGLSKEVATEGIRVNAVAVGLVDTDLHAAAGEPGRPDRMRPTIPMQRSGTVEEVAAAIVWLLGDQSSYTTGTILAVSGGR